MPESAESQDQSKIQALSKDEESREWEVTVVIDQLRKEELYKELSNELITDIAKKIVAAREEALVDPLTGLANRRRFDNDLASTLREIKKSPNSSSDTWLLIFDIDKFKYINDIYGHQVGDAVLQGISNLNARVAEHIYRMGGEEFCQILTRLKQEDVIKLLQRYAQEARIIGNAILTSAKADPEALKRLKLQSPPRTVTLSFGITPFLATDTATAVTERSDAAVYKSKHDGRDRMTIYQADDEGKYITIPIVQNPQQNTIQ